MSQECMAVKFVSASGAQSLIGADFVKAIPAFPGTMKNVFEAVEAYSGDGLPFRFDGLGDVYVTNSAGKTIAHYALVPRADELAD
jgi:hypothetical protein